MLRTVRRCWKFKAFPKLHFACRSPSRAAPNLLLAGCNATKPLYDAGLLQVGDGKDVASRIETGALNSGSRAPGLCYGIAVKDWNL